MRRIAALLLLALAGCGGADGPASVVPADASIYLGVDASRAEAIMSATSRDDVDFERDVRPWLGDRAAYFANESADAAGLVLATEDEEAAEAFGRRVTAAGPLRASAIVDGHLVIASTRELLQAANAAAGGQSLADSTRLDVDGEDGEDAPDALLAVREPGALDGGLELAGLDAVDLPPELGDGPLTARTRGERTEITGLPAESPPALDDIPGAAWLAVASADLSAGDAAGALTDELRRIRRWPELGLEGLFAHLGAGTFYIQGRSRLDSGARLVAETADEAALRRSVARLARGIPRRQWSVDPNVGEDFLQIGVARRGRPGPFFYLQVENGRLVIDFGEQTGGVAEDLPDTPRYRDAERRLGGAPTLLIEDEDGSYTAARRDGGTFTLVTRAG
jgi:hypothetical protein